MRKIAFGLLFALMLSACESAEERNRQEQLEWLCNNGTPQACNQ